MNVVNQSLVEREIKNLFYFEIDACEKIGLLNVYKYNIGQHIMNI